MDIIVYGEKPKLGLFSGIHGDEAGIITSVKKAVDAYKVKLPSFVFIPVCSPSAIRLHTRNNEEGIDLNRSFIKHSQSKEAQTLISLLKPYSFELCVDFHEDTELSGVYLYDSENIEGSEALKSFRSKVKIVAPLYSGIDDTTDEKLGGKSFEGYRVSNSPVKDEHGEYIYEGFFDYWALIEGKTKRWLTLEIPTTLSKLQKDDIVDIFFQTFIVENITYKQ